MRIFKILTCVIKLPSALKTYQPHSPLLAHSIAGMWDSGGTAHDVTKPPHFSVSLPDYIKLRIETSLFSRNKNKVEFMLIMMQ